MDLGAEIKRLRLQKNLTLRELGERAGVDHTYLSKIETGKVAPPRRPALTRIAKALELPPEYLYLYDERHPGRDQEFRGLAVFEILRELCQRPEVVTPEHWQEILSTAKEAGFDDQYHLLSLIKFIEEIPINEPQRLSRHKQRFPLMWSEMPAKFKRSVRKLFYVLLRGTAGFEVENARVIEELIATGKRVLIVAQHRNITGLIGYLMKTKPAISGLNSIVCMVSDSDDGRDALHFFQQSRVNIIPVIRQRSGVNQRSRASLQFSKLLKESEYETVGGIVVDERQNGRERQLSSGPILIAARCHAVIVPVVARNKVEVVLENSWDKHRIPLSYGKIYIDEPFALLKGHGDSWRDEVIKQLDDRLEELDKIIGQRIGSLQVKLGF
jgi:transcriptional regulator with XRE-family HTH domain/lysophospholipid acyltransferase (LPLAT)-like uncharacterized protein